ncbi:MAG: hypothetical protein ACR5KV_03275 [Wolbachia sp.]
MTLSDQLNGKIEQELLNDAKFITELVNKITASVGVNGVYTKQQQILQELLFS